MWMQKGSQRKYVPEWQVASHKRQGWSQIQTAGQPGVGPELGIPGADTGGREAVIGAESQAEEIRKKITQNKIEGDSVVKLKEFQDYLVQNSGSWGMDLEGALHSWIRDNTDLQGVQVLSIREAGQHNGHITWQAEIRLPEGSYSGYGPLRGGNPLAGFDRGHRTITIESPIGTAATTAQERRDEIDRFISEERDRDPWNIRGTAFDEIPDQVAHDMTNRLTNLQGFLPQEQWSTAISEVQDVLSNKSLGSPERRQVLADMVMGEIEASANSFAWAQGADWEAIGNLIAPPQIPTGGGGGFGRSAPIYQPPDRREVEENVRNYLALVLADSSDRKLVAELTDTYMNEHRRSFNNPGIGLRPWFSVKEKVHQMEEYKKLHALRPDTIDEEQWIPQFQQLIDQAGVPVGLRDQTARNFAQIGATQPAAARAAFRQQEMRTGHTQPIFLRNLAGAVGALARKF